jgi:hypothetical protein
MASKKPTSKGIANAQTRSGGKRSAQGTAALQAAQARQQTRSGKTKGGKGGRT